MGNTTWALKAQPSARPPVLHARGFASHCLPTVQEPLSRTGIAGWVELNDAPRVARSCSWRSLCRTFDATWLVER
jgi:hypothetical protein